MYNKEDENGDSIYNNKYLFSWKEKDKESDLQYFEARYYDDEVGRFRSIDKIFWEVGGTSRWTRILYDPQQLNAYHYSRNNPLKYIDPKWEAIQLFAADTYVDIWITAYDTWRIYKNILEISAWWWMYWIWMALWNEDMMLSTEIWIDNDASQLSDAWSNTIASVAAVAIPWVSALAVKGMRKG